MNTRILILYYSTYGHVEALAAAVAEGAREIAGTAVAVKRVPELMPEEVARAAGAKLDQSAPVAAPQELADYDAILFGAPTRFGNMASQMRNFIDQTGSLWLKGALVGKVASVFTSTGTGGGNEATILTAIPPFLHHGMIFVGLPYTARELTDVSAVRGGSPYGAATIAGPDGQRVPSSTELALARFQGRHVAQIAAQLKAGRSANLDGETR